MCAEKSPKPREQPIIGVLDSGVGGLTVVSQLANLMPGAKVLYFGDNINVPYGNRSEDEIFKLASRMFDFLEDRGASLVAIACNTISALTERFQAAYRFPIFSIIDPAAEYAAAHCGGGVGVLATEFTIKSLSHSKKIRSIDPNIPVYGEGSARLAALIDSGDFDGTAIEQDISSHLNRLLGHGEVKDVILGCTHYPLVLDVFQKLAPSINFIDPALLQARKVFEYVAAAYGPDAEAGRGLSPSEISDGARALDLHIYTTGSSKAYEIFLKRLKLDSGAEIKKLTI